MLFLMQPIVARRPKRGPGLRAVIVAGCLILLALVGLISRYVPAAEPLSQVAVIGLVVFGMFSLRGLGLPSGAKVGAFVFLTASTVAALVSTQSSLEYAFRGWIGLVTALFAATAVAGAILGARRQGRGRQATLVILVALGIGAITNVLVALRQAVLGMDAAEIAQARAGVSTFESGQWVRLMGTFATNQDFGLFAGCTAPAVFALALTYRGRRRGWLFVLAAALYLVVILSLTRTALIASIAAGAFALIVLSRGGATTRVLRTLVIGSSIVFIGVSVLSQVSNPRVQDALLRASTLFDLSDDVSFNARKDATLPRALSAFQQNPLGSGAGSAGPVSQAYPNYAPFGSMTTDNGYLMIGIQVGIIGVVAFVLMLLLTMRHLSISDSPFSKAGAASIVALLVAMISAQYWALLAPASLVAAIVGIGIAHASPAVRHRDSAKARQNSSLARV